MHRKIIDRNGITPLKICINCTCGGATPFQIVGGHGHGRREERGLKVQRHQDTEEQGIDAKVGEQRQEDRHEDDDDLGPFKRPAQAGR